jgi:hypothetical protein
MQRYFFSFNLLPSIQLGFFAARANKLEYVATFESNFLMTVRYCLNVHFSELIFLLKLHKVEAAYCD